MEHLFQVFGQFCRLLRLFTDHVVCVACRGLHGVLEEERIDDADQRENDEEHVWHPDYCVEGIAVDQKLRVGRPAAAEGHLEERVERPRGRAEVLERLQAVLQADSIGLDDVLLQQPAEQERAHEHEDEQDQHRPDHGAETQDDRLHEHAELREDVHGAYHAEHASQAENPHRAQKGKVEVRHFNQCVDAGNDHNHKVKNVE
mmetsp:Transcript_50571/g.140300  ORF Transcript_50571/g.140300 Transcript_50571/m.140300 type:complete len:202 (-) Transcript_50571:1089-1694(-)